ncbi:transposase [Streptomyces chartreusis]|uniref:transposase n=1 Tax=Streptomyces chartreusis TaxID=1969 RepID=UPI0033A10A59
MCGGRPGSHRSPSRGRGDRGRYAAVPTAGHLSSWAGVCPGNHESAGKITSGRTRHGEAWLRGVLRNAAAATARSKDTYRAAQFRRLVGHRGKRRARRRRALDPRRRLARPHRDTPLPGPRRRPLHPASASPGRPADSSANSPHSATT